VYAACHQIRALDPRPGSRFGNDAPPVYIRPDLVVRKTETGFEVTMNDGYLPRLGISGYYNRLASETNDESVRDYLSLKIRQAQWVLNGIEQRRATLLGCAKEIVTRQGAFFRRGRGHLTPMTQAELAEILGVHESTVSRTIRGKYLQCCFGIFPLDFFFSRALADGCGGEVSAEAAKERIRALVADENPKKPLSDQRLSDLLAEEGIALSRRTVAKYRDELGISNTAGRRAQGA
ncbi:MAG TPA: RNA polymerase sigma-54 factor, partial [Oscillospiraceae bacterium]|nr:RNA polymerase sigma-54 factor [Oscillospiraceae bacterium]